MENKAEDGLVLVEETSVVPLNLGMLQGVTPDQMLKEAEAIATPLKEFIKDRGLFHFFGGDRPHVEATGWSTMLIMLGVAPQEISVTRIPVDRDGWGDEFEAKIALVRISDQQVVCSASASCGGVDEYDWHFKNKYKWVGPENDRKKVPDGVVPVAGNSRRSMAITRAVGKAARVGFSWIMEVAGYSPTPAEEMPQDDRVDPDRKQQPEGKDPLGREKVQQKSKATEVRQMTANQPFTCGLCRGPGKANEDIAFYMDENDDPHSAHWDPCYLDTQNAKEGQ